MRGPRQHGGLIRGCFTVIPACENLDEEKEEKEA